MKKKIMMFNDPILARIMPQVIDFDETVLEIVQDMKDTLKAAKNGVGLAAPQIGYEARIILVRDQVIVNPAIEYMRGMQRIKEGCLSYPGKFVTTFRPTEVKVVGFDEYGVPLKRVYKSFSAAIVMHELDHLNGSCILAERKSSAA